MKAHGNGAPETCVHNLLRLTRNEVPFDRVRGRDGALIDQPNTMVTKIKSDVKWLLETFEPRVIVKNINIDSSLLGNYNISVDIARKEEDDE